MKCGDCGDRSATRYALDGNVVRFWCICCRHGGTPIRSLWLRPLTIVWHHWMKLRGGAKGRQKRLRAAAQRHYGRVEIDREPA